jgi:Protein of unknown function (DUF1549)/Protein of unknown function (DUF1553)/Planctomycete cytochrome C
VLDEAQKVSYTRDVRPILLKNCNQCHSAEERTREFEITSVPTLLTAGRNAGPGVVPGKPENSAIIQYITGLRLPQMPKDHDPLTEVELHTLRQWIFAGARDDSPEAQSLRAVSKEPATVPASQQVTDPLARRMLDSSAFAAEPDKQALFLAWRESRISKLPAPPAIPANGPANPIDRFIAQKWTSANLPATAPLCDDATFARRVYLDLIGLTPTIPESLAFASDTSPNKRARLIDQLLDRADDYAAHWTPFWEDALGSGVKTGGLRSRERYTDWIYQNFRENRPYDLFVAELLNPAMESRAPHAPARVRPPRDYILTKNHDETLVSVSNTAQVFLGTGMKCASCHNHFLNREWTQSRFLAMAGLFSPRDLELIRCEKPSGKYVAAEFAFQLPELPTMTSADRLQLAVVLMVDPHNPRFAPSIVNRLWKRYIGLGLFEPVDDYRDDTPPSHPDLLRWLTDDFVRHGFDLKHTTRLILGSQTYQRKYDPAIEDHFDLAKPADPRYYRSASLRRLTAEQFIDSVRLAVNQKIDRKSRAYLNVESTSLSRALGRPAARAEITTTRSDDVAVVQSLELLNGREIHQMVYSGAMLQSWAAAGPTHAVQQVYLAILARQPTNEEQKLAEDYLKDQLTPQAVGDLCWALVCSPEFQYVR